MCFCGPEQSCAKDYGDVLTYHEALITAEFCCLSSNFSQSTCLVLLPRSLFRC